MSEIQIRKANQEDLDAVKALADQEKASLGFITRGTFREAINNSQVMVVDLDHQVIGFQHYYHRKRDLQTTFYQKVINENYRRRGFGRMLVDAVAKESRDLGREFILVKCPVDLESNAFHKAYGFKRTGTESGRIRRLNIWRLDL